jgi:hypothetical protein
MVGGKVGYGIWSVCCTVIHTFNVQLLGGWPKSEGLEA